MRGTVEYIRRRWEWAALAVILFAGALLRLALTAAWRPALLGYPDSGAYMAAARTPFADHMRPQGYPAFIDLIGKFHDGITSVIFVQHGLGLATAVLLFLLPRMIGAPRWAGLIPAAVVALGGDLVFVEHALLSEALFIFLIVAGLTATVAAVNRETAAGWSIALAALGGLLIGASGTVRAAGLFLLPVAAIYLAAALPRPALLRAAAALAALAACSVALISLMAWHDHSTGRFVMTETQYYNYYGRVATFADCEQFDPPAKSRYLCPKIPVRDRMGHEFWVFNPATPLVARYGDGFSDGISKNGASEVKAFALAAVLGQPGAYASAVGRDFVRLFAPDFPRSSNPRIGNNASGLSASRLMEVYEHPGWTNNVIYQETGQTIENYGHYGDTGPLRTYASLTRFADVRLALLLLLAIAAPFLVGGRQRAGALLFLASGSALLFIPLLIAKYDFRFTLPAMPLLAVAAAVSVAALVERLRARRAASGEATPAVS